MNYSYLLVFIISVILFQNCGSLSSSNNNLSEQTDLASQTQGQTGDTNSFNETDDTNNDPSLPINPSTNDSGDPLASGLFKIQDGTISAGDCIIDPSQKVKCRYKENLLVRDLVNIVDLSGSRYHNCALNNENSIFCWGFNRGGVIGDTPSGNTPIKLTENLPANIKRIRSGDHSICALTGSGELYCWGLNQYFETGNTDSNFDQGYGPGNTKPTRVNDLKVSAVDFSLSNGYACALGVDKNVYCWGKHVYLGPESLTYTPGTPLNPVLGVSNSVAISAGRKHVCAVSDKNLISCWGDSVYFTNAYNTPFFVSYQWAGDDIVQIKVGYQNTCFLTSKKQVFCFDNDTTKGPEDFNAISKLNGSVGLELIVGPNAITGSNAETFPCGVNEQAEVSCFYFDGTLVRRFE